MKTLLLAALLLTAAIAAVPSASADDNPTDCNAVVKDYDSDGQPDFVAVGCNDPVRGCLWANLDDQQRYCTGRPS